MLWRKKRPKEDTRVLTEKDIQKKLYGSYLKPVQDERVVAANEARERLEKARKEESLKRMKTEEELAGLQVDMARAEKMLGRSDKQKQILQKKLSRTLVAKKAQAAMAAKKAEAATAAKKAQADTRPTAARPAATRPKFRITSTTTLLNLSPKSIILFLALILVLLASFRLISQRKRRLPEWRVMAPISTARKELAKPYTIQICVYEKKDEAEKLVNDLKERGHPAWLVSRTSPKGRLYYNIYIGQFAKHEDASKFLKKLGTKEEFKQFKDRFIKNLRSRARP